MGGKRGYEREGKRRVIEGREGWGKGEGGRVKKDEGRDERERVGIFRRGGSLY